MEYLVLAFSAIIVNNVLLSQYLGICSFIGVSKKRSSSIGMGLAVMFVLLLASAVCWLLYAYVLTPLNITYLYIIVFILVIAFLVQLVEMILKKYIPSLYKVLGIYLPLITTNCAIMGVATYITVKSPMSFLSSMVYALGIGIGYILVMFIFATIRERLESANVPKPFKGVAIALIMAGLMAMAFMGFNGVL